jgi:hypothetical protein|tara:strand:- start:510 stop:632 length:123 start_codon:yes stop_codon:yes gene_type:complete
MDSARPRRGLGFGVLGFRLSFQALGVLVDGAPVGSRHGSD